MLELSFDRGSSPASTARQLGADLLLLSGMGHDLPRGLRPLLSDVIAANARRAAASGGEPATLHRLGELGQDVGELQ
jgi:hypothetical protein